MGVRQAQDGEKADICIINTCSVTEVADHKCRQAIRRMIRQHPDALVVVTGCYAQLSSGEIGKIDGVDLILGSDEKAELLRYVSDAFSGASSVKTHVAGKTKDIKSFAPSCSRGNRTRYFLKVQDGCDYFCTYCTIPFARGFSRNASVEFLVGQAKEVAREGGKEIVLTGVNIGDFGKTTGERFVDLVKALDDVEGIERYRISSMEPDLISRELIETCAKSRAFMPHWHIPLQSGSDVVLKLMHRHYSRQLFADKVLQIKELMPEAFIGVDVMTGCRGETQECFEETFDFLDSLPVSQLHVFPYSERPGTQALNIQYTVSDADRKERTHRLIQLSDAKTQQFYTRHIGAEAEVLLEKNKRGQNMSGFTRNYVRVAVQNTADRDELENSIVKVRLMHYNKNKTALVAEMI